MEPVFEIVVGPVSSSKTFLAHKAILSKEPKFRAQCNNFKEADEKRIYLQEDEPEIFTLVLQYLYSGDCWPRWGAELEGFQASTADAR